MLKTRLSRVSMIAAACALAACSESATAPGSESAARAVIAGLASRAPSLAVSGGPDLSDYKTFQGEVWICKDGNVAGTSFPIDYIVVRRSDGSTVVSGTVSVPVGQCVLAASVLTEVNGRYEVTATEHLLPANWSLTAIDWAYGLNFPLTPPPPTIDLATRTISAVLIANDVGVQLTFTNVFTPPPSGEIGDFVWYDVDGNGVQDPGEAGIAGVMVTLAGATSGTATTDANGFYLFTGLAAGDYTVSAATPSGLNPSPSGQGGDATKDSNGSPASVTLPTNSSSDRTIDFGYTKGTGKIGDYVWYDKDGDGVQDSFESGIAGVTVTLGGASSATTTTDASGAYLFSGLSAGDYTVTPNTPSGYAPSPSLQGGDPAMDSNGSPASVTLASNSSSDLTIDFGYVKPKGEIGNYVWYDKDGDGIQDWNESGIKGVTVTLAGPVNRTTTTSHNGGYLFSGLPAGMYTVTVGTVSGYVPTKVAQGSDRSRDSNANPATVVLPSGSSTDYTIDFGFDKISVVPCVQPTTHWVSHWYEWDSSHDGKVFTKYTMFYRSGMNNWSMINMSTKNGNAYVLLAQELITAQLSRGFYQSTGSSTVDAAIAGAEAYFSSAAAGVQYPSGSLKTQLLAWASTLDQWTDGKKGTPICSKCW